MDIQLLIEQLMHSHLNLLLYGLTHISKCSKTWYQLYLLNHSCWIPFTKLTMFPYCEQVEDIEHYGASVGDELIQENEMFFYELWVY